MTSWVDEFDEKFPDDVLRREWVRMFVQDLQDRRVRETESAWYDGRNCASGVGATPPDCFDLWRSRYLT